MFERVILPVHNLLAPRMDGTRIFERPPRPTEDEDRRFRIPRERQEPITLIPSAFLREVYQSRGQRGVQKRTMMVGGKRKDDKEHGQDQGKRTKRNVCFPTSQSFSFNAPSSSSS